MKRNLKLSTILISLLLSIVSTSESNAATTITKIYDGDTITLNTGERVRLLQIDTPELSSEECYAEEARSALVSLLNTSGQLNLQSDPKLDKKDKYGRLLRYVFVGKTNINLKMVELGAAAPYFYKGNKGQFSSQILKAAQNAKAKSLGLWSSCPGTLLTPTFALSTKHSVQNAFTNANYSKTNCDPNYAGCIPVYPPDLNCTEIKKLGLAPVRVIGRDVHKLDRDGNGIGCDK